MPRLKHFQAEFAESAPEALAKYLTRIFSNLSSSPLGPFKDFHVRCLLSGL
jgi:hypothetical protein